MGTLVLVPEFPGGGWFADGSGSAITDSDGSVMFDGYNRRNCYRMSCSADTLKDFTLQVEVELPDGFSDWATNAVVIEFCSVTTSPSDQALDVAVHRNRSGTATYTSSNNVSQSGGTWTTLTISESSIESGGTTWSAGDTLTLKLKCKSKSGYYVAIGKIRIAYE